MQYTWIFLPARAILEAVKAIIEATTHEVSDTEKAVHKAEQQVTTSQQAVAAASTQLDFFRKAVQQQAALLGDGAALQQQCRDLQALLEAAERDAATVKDQRLRAREVVARLLNRAEQASYALTKADYAAVVLLVCDVALDDGMLGAFVRGIVSTLEDHDDKAGSVAGVTTEEHPEGLLKYVNAKLARMPPPAPRAGIAGLMAPHRISLVKQAAAVLASPEVYNVGGEEKARALDLLAQPIFT
jgi:hypothetical protein